MHILTIRYCWSSDALLKKESMWSGLTSGFSNAIQSLDQVVLSLRAPRSHCMREQAARDAIVANLGDEELSGEPLTTLITLHVVRSLICILMVDEDDIEDGQEDSPEGPSCFC